MNFIIHNFQSWEIALVPKHHKNDKNRNRSKTLFYTDYCISGKVKALSLTLKQP